MRVKKISIEWLPVDPAPNHWNLHHLTVIEQTVSRVINEILGVKGKNKQQLTYMYTFFSFSSMCGYCNKTLLGFSRELKGKDKSTHHKYEAF